MSFHDLEILLKTIFQRATRTGNATHKTTLKNLCLSTLSATHMPWWKMFLLGKFSFQIKSALAVFLVFGALFSLFQSESYAGEIKPTFGLVELTRDGKTRIIRDTTKLKVGDIVQVASSAQANIKLNNQAIESEALAHTEVRIMDKDKIFLSEGTLENQIKKQAEIATKRGKISAQNGKGIISVTPTGETKVTAVKNQLEISDWLDRSIRLTSGETIKLTTDSNLTNTNPSKTDILTESLLNKIRAKLLISQTKILNGIHTINEQKQRTIGQAELHSAQKSFKTIYSILNQAFTGKKVNIEQITLAQVIEIIQAHTNDAQLLTEAKATKIFLEKAMNESVAFALPDEQENKHFYNYQVIEKVFETYAENNVKEKNLLQKKYLTRAQAEFAELKTPAERRFYLSTIPQRTLFYASLVSLTTE
ncbi:hypothetical protein CSB37_01205 [bacterium DOLZORAL124_38_8]|nr:MAG: hypothetical protein CSB37_01205 [bacterium DOLZORAL124_38_8]